MKRAILVDRLPDAGEEFSAVAEGSPIRPPKSPVRLEQDPACPPRAIAVAHGEVFQVEREAIVADKPAVFADKSPIFRTRTRFARKCFRLAGNVSDFGRRVCGSSG